MSELLHRIIVMVVFTVRIIVANIVDFIEEKYVKIAYAGRISTSDLVQRIYNFCEVYSGKVMYPYQAQFSKRIIRSVLENDGAELTALFARQSGKTETVAITVGFYRYMPIIISLAR